jgi:hypothetical protein
MSVRDFTDGGAYLSGVVCLGAKCRCGAEAHAELHSEVFGAWDVCRPCGERQIAELHGIDPFDPGALRADATVGARAAEQGERALVQEIRNALSAARDHVLYLGGALSVRPHCGLADFYLDELEHHLEKASDEIDYLVNAVRCPDRL